MVPQSGVPPAGAGVQKDLLDVTGIGAVEKQLPGEALVGPQLLQNRPEEVVVPHIRLHRLIQKHLCGLRFLQMLLGRIQQGAPQPQGQGGTRGGRPPKAHR